MLKLKKSLLLENIVIEKVLCDKMNLFYLFEIYMKDMLEVCVF